MSSKVNSKYILPAMISSKPVKEFFNDTDSNNKFSNNDFKYGTSGKKAYDITPSPLLHEKVPEAKLNSRAMRLERGTKNYRRSIDFTE